METFLLATAFIWLVAASISDIKRREVPDWLSFSLIAIALATRAIFSVFTRDISHFVYGIAGLFTFFLLSFLLYRAKIFAGGDMKIMSALGAVFALEKISFSFLFNILLVGFFYCLLYSAFLAFKNKSSYIREVKKIKIKKEKIISFFLSFVLLFLVFITRQYQMLWIVAFFFAFPFLLLFVKAVENSCLVKEVPPEKLTEGDWLLHDIRIGKKTIKARFSGLDKKEIALIKKEGIRVKVKYGIPFVPVFLLSFVASLAFGNLLAKIARMLL